MALNARKKIMVERDAEGYGPRFRLECRQIFLKERSLAAVQRGLARRGYKKNSIPSSGTLKKWRDEELWNEELIRRDAALEPDLDLDLDPLDKIFERVSVNVREIKEEIDKLRGNKAVRSSELSQLYHAYNRALHINALVAKIKADADRDRNEATPVEVIFRGLKQVKALKPLLENKEILIDISNAISAEMLEFTQRAVGISG